MSPLPQHVIDKFLERCRREDHEAGFRGVDPQVLDRIAALVMSKHESEND